MAEGLLDVPFPERIATISLLFSLSIITAASSSVGLLFSVSIVQITEKEKRVLQYSAKENF